MSTRDDASLTARERAALASLEASAAAEDPQLASRLRGSSRFRMIAHLPRVPAWVGSPWCAGSLVLVGLALVIISLSTTSVLGVAGLVMAAYGCCGLAGVVERLARRGGPDEPT
jgi:hypothetical protein